MINIFKRNKLPDFDSNSFKGTALPNNVIEIEFIKTCVVRKGDRLHYTVTFDPITILPGPLDENN
jgi:hypothetical protein